MGDIKEVRILVTYIFKRIFELAEIINNYYLNLLSTNLK